MEGNMHIRWGWLKFMYIYTLVGAGGFGLGMIVMPGAIQSTFRFPNQDPVIFGAYGSLLVAFGILSIFGLRSPLRFVPVLTLQLCYKLIWFIGVIVPLLRTGQFPPYALTLVLIFATYILGDLIAIPFSYVFARRPVS